MGIKKYRKALAFGVIALTLIVFIAYYINNPAVWQTIKTIPFIVFVKIIALYVMSIFALSIVTIGTLKLCKIKMPLQQSILLTMYTAVVNFFGPLQSGPAFRGVYLKQKYGLSLVIYAAASSVYYLLWGGISVLLLFSSLLKWWLIPIILIGILVVLQIERKQRSYQKFKALDMKSIYILCFATILQIVIISLIYYVELNNVTSGISYSQVLVYTGAANLALFVSLTPGAIGFREAFLIFSQRLHGISTEAIVAANTIDRAMYFILLVILATYIATSHVKTRLNDSLGPRITKN
jgi:uncharacterized membrane protein YbhN (UPF0104 family)